MSFEIDIPDALTVGEFTVDFYAACMTVLVHKVQPSLAVEMPADTDEQVVQYTDIKSCIERIVGYVDTFYKDATTKASNTPSFSTHAHDFERTRTAAGCTPNPNQNDC